MEYPPDRLDYRFADLFTVFMYEYMFVDEESKNEEADRTRLKEELVRLMLDIFKDSIEENHDKQGLAFNPRPYYRMLLFFINTTHASGLHLFLLPFADFLHEVAPLNLPGFAITWVELFSHGNYMPRLFKLPQLQERLALLVCDMLALLTDIMPEAEETESAGALNYFQANVRILELLR